MTGRALLRARQFFGARERSEDGWNERSTYSREWGSAYRRRWQHDRPARPRPSSQDHGLPPCAAFRLMGFVSAGRVRLGKRVVDSGHFDPRTLEPAPPS